MHFLFLGIVALALFILFSRGIANADPKLLARIVRIAGGVVSLAFAVALAITGRWFFALPVGMFGYSLLAGNRLASPFGSGRQRTAGQRSAVRSAYLEMTLDHDTGDMDGRVLAGRFEGAELSQMAQAELFALHADVESDPQSVALLEAYFDRRMSDWRDHASSRSGASSGGGVGGGAMDREEAFAILGLEPGASEEAIRKAHRTLMKRFHPDQGGSDYLAAKINEAKDILLGEG